MYRAGLDVDVAPGQEGGGCRAALPLSHLIGGNRLRTLQARDSRLRALQARDTGPGGRLLPRCIAPLAPDRKSMSLTY